MPEHSIKNARTRTTFRDSEGFERTALIVNERNGDGSIDIVHADGQFLGRLNIFTNEDGSWLAVDVIDVEDRYETRNALVFNDGRRTVMNSKGRVVAADFRK